MSLLSLGNSINVTSNTAICRSQTHVLRKKYKVLVFILLVKPLNRKARFVPYRKVIQYKSNTKQELSEIICSVADQARSVSSLLYMYGHSSTRLFDFFKNFQSFFSIY